MTKNLYNLRHRKHGRYEMAIVQPVEYWLHPATMQRWDIEKWQIEAARKGDGVVGIRNGVLIVIKK